MGDTRTPVAGPESWKPGRVQWGCTHQATGWAGCDPHLARSPERLNFSCLLKKMAKTSSQPSGHLVVHSDTHSNTVLASFKDPSLMMAISSSGRGLSKVVATSHMWILSP